MTASAAQIAEILLDGFLNYREQFQRITHDARDRFAHGKWQDVQTAARDRILLYHQAKADVCEAVQQANADLALEAWIQVKEEYRQRITGRHDAELAATFYNTIFRGLGGRENLSVKYAFVGEDRVMAKSSGVSLTRRHTDRDLGKVIEQAISETDLGVPFIDSTSDVNRVVEKLAADIPLLRAGVTSISLELLTSVFYRNKGAYLIGRLNVEGHVFPLAFAMRRDDEGASVDAVLWGENRLSVIFSFTRAYFMVEVEEPTRTVNYLSSLLPVKKRWELFTSIGLYKHGKTEFMHDYHRHLEQSDDFFVEAEGIKGQVMLVFALASYQIVFKVMKDRFPATKSVTHDDVEQAYLLVKTHDRVGRMADTQEFHHFVFPKERFTESVLEELMEKAGNSVSITDKEVIIDHLYTERLMTPLNIYINDCNQFHLQKVLDEYGHAIRQMAAANIFPGDMLLKNFGVTRHGRVVFYDYDEICYLTDINFRDLPEADNAGGQQSAEPWFEVGEYDVFPEEFANFLFPEPGMQEIFRNKHGEIFTAAYWQGVQNMVKQDQLMDVYPYPISERLI